MFNIEGGGGVIVREINVLGEIGGGGVHVREDLCPGGFMSYIHVLHTGFRSTLIFAKS